MANSAQFQDDPLSEMYTYDDFLKWPSTNERTNYRIHPSGNRILMGLGARIHPTAKVGNGVELDKYSTIYENVELGGGSRVGQLSLVESGCSLGPNTIVGDHVTINKNTCFGKGSIIAANSSVGDNCNFPEWTRIMRETCLDGSNIIAILTLGRCPRGYPIHGVMLRDRTYRFSAGCRFFTFEQAREHWGNSYYLNGGKGDAQEMLLRVDFAEQMLKYHYGEPRA